MTKKKSWAQRNRDNFVWFTLASLVAVLLWAQSGIQLGQVTTQNNVILTQNNTLICQNSDLIRMNGAISHGDVVTPLNPASCPNLGFAPPIFIATVKLTASLGVSVNCGYGIVMNSTGPTDCPQLVKNLLGNSTEITTRLIAAPAEHILF